jgi:SAM-dependent MidA family methyltransferase
MSVLKQTIIEKIKGSGAIPFDEFMEMALYYPELGYYTRDAALIGRKGDFYTSAHLHRIFGAMLGRQMHEMWQIMGMPEVFHIVEMGAGEGYLAKDMLDYLFSAGCCKNFFDSIEYVIIEVSPSLRQSQMQLLRSFEGKVRWVESIKQLPEYSINGCFLSNELIDAFPVKIVVMDNGLYEIYVDTDGAGFAEIKKPCSESIESYFKEFSVELPEGYKTEVNLTIKQWLADVSAVLSEGFILTIDYGYPAWDYYSEDRSRGTLLCYCKHQINEDPYINIGEQDITAHVNFSALKKWGEPSGLKTVGFCPQGIYLASLGIDEVMKEFYGDSPDAFETAKIKGLLLPQGMGESHKVLVQYKGKRSFSLKGFNLRNHADRL